MMNSNELRTAYAELYGYMANSREPKNMKAFGKVMTEMFNWVADTKPEVAQEWYDELLAIRWHQYLTHKEAEAIVNNMKPGSPWPYDAWKKTMERLGVPTEEQPLYNSFALWTEMSKMYSDFGGPIAELKGMPLADIPAEDMVRATHMMAMATLKDQDGVYDIRRYFGLSE